MRLTWNIVASAIVTLVLAPSVTAKACTTTELTKLTSVAATYSSSPDCAGSALDNSANTMAVICAGACMKLVRQLQPDAPDCEFEGTNLGETMKQLVTWCDAAESASASSSNSAAESTGEGSNLTVPNTTDTVPTCSIEDVTLINDLNSEAEKNADCLGSAGTAIGATTKAVYCAEDACVAYLTDLEDRLPNCTYGNYNIKQVVADTLTKCEDPSITWPNTTTPTATKASTIAPTTTTQAPIVVPSGDSQASDTPAPTESAAYVLKPSATFVAASAMVLTITFAW